MDPAAISMPVDDDAGGGGGARCSLSEEACFGAGLAFVGGGVGARFAETGKASNSPEDRFALAPAESKRKIGRDIFPNLHLDQVFRVSIFDTAGHTSNAQSQVRGSSRTLASKVQHTLEGPLSNTNFESSISLNPQSRPSRDAETRGACPLL